MEARRVAATTGRNHHCALENHNRTQSWGGDVGGDSGSRQGDSLNSECHGVPKELQPSHAHCDSFEGGVQPANCGAAATGDSRLYDRGSVTLSAPYPRWNLDNGASTKCRRPRHAGQTQLGDARRRAPRGTGTRHLRVDPRRTRTTADSAETASRRSGTKPHIQVHCNLAAQCVGETCACC